MWESWSDKISESQETFLSLRPADFSPNVVGEKKEQIKVREKKKTLLHKTTT